MALIKTIAILFAGISFTSLALGAFKERPLFTMKKSHNPENIMVIYAQTDENCQFKPFDDGSYLNYYWLMNGKKRKRVHPLIKKGIAKRVEFKKVKNSSESVFEANLNDLKEVKHDLPSTTIKVVTNKNDRNCKPRAVMKLGPKGKNKTINLVNTYCDVDKNLFGVPTGCESLSLQGVSKTKEKDYVTVRFYKK